MPRRPNTLLRILVPLIAMLTGIVLFVLAIYVNTSRHGRSSGPAAVQPPPTQQDAPDQSRAPPAPAAAPVDQPGAAGPALTGPLSAEVLPALPAPEPTPIGGLTGDEFTMELRPSWIGAGIGSITFARLYDTIHRTVRTRIQAEHPPLAQLQPGDLYVAPMALLGLEIDGQWVGLSEFEEGSSRPRAIWQEVAPGAFRAYIVDATGRRVVQVDRRYVVQRRSYDVVVEQRVRNLVAAPIELKWVQLGPVDLPQDAVTYGGDKRRVRFGYLLSPVADPSAQGYVQGRAFGTLSRQSVLGKRYRREVAPGRYVERYRPTEPVWPNDISRRDQLELVWVGMTNRYFGVAIHPLATAGSVRAEKVLSLAERVDRLVLDTARAEPVLALRLSSPTYRIEPGQELSLDAGLYAGPLSKPLMRRLDAAHERLTSAGLDRLVVYNFGGPCAWCTFSWLTDPLLWLLRALHAVVRDWGIAIMLLVCIVRLVLHPVTKWSQIRMQRFARQMQAIAPKQQKIQERFKDDRRRMQQEIQKLWREEGISPSGLLGCLPMFLQSPIWIALYATLYFAWDLRHQPAFYGVFQAMGGWSFLGDLAEPDHFIPLGRALFSLPFMGPVSAINLLPVLLGVVFWVHQKYLTPPPTAALTPEQQQQQRIMRIISVVMFPVIMYNAPSGLSLYFITNSAIAIVESRRIRAYAEKRDLFAPRPRDRRATGAEGWLARLQRAAEAQRQRRMADRGAVRGGPASPTSRRGSRRR